MRKFINASPSLFSFVFSVFISTLMYHIPAFANAPVVVISVMFLGLFFAEIKHQIDWNGIGNYNIY
jgi:hypothetical protein